MDKISIVYGMFILILVYLLVQNQQNTTGVIGAIGGQVTNTITALQGKGTGSTGTSIA